MSYTFAKTATIGDHTIAVMAIDALGGYSAWVTNTFTLLNNAPDLNPISGPDTVYRGDTVTFHVAGHDDEGDYPLSYKWTIDGYDMGVDNPTLSFVHMSDPSSVGDHVVAVRATDNLGAVSAWVTKNFKTLNHAPTVSDISGPTSGNPGTYTWTATGSDAEGDALTYEWYVDGTYKSGGSSFTYTFSSSDTIGSHTIKVRVKDAVGDYSDYSTLTFNLNAPEKVAAPTFSPAGGTYSSSQSVVLSCSTSGATVRYTVDGSEPSSTSAVYSSPIVVSSTTTVKAKAFKDGMTDSDTASATYTIIPKIATPTFSPSGGTYSSAQNVALNCATEGATIHFTVDGSEPSSTSAVYSSPIVVSSTTTVKAKAFKTGMTDSDTASATYTINIPSKVATPTFSPPGGTYSSSQNVALSCSTDGATIRYTVDGSEPTSSSTVYSGPISVSSGTVTVKAKAFKDGMTDSDTASATYTISVEPAKVAAPTFSPSGGTYSSSQSVVLSCSTSGATIRYTVDGSEPSASSTVYSSPISVGVTTTIKAKAFKSGMTDSDTTTATYTISVEPAKVAAPTFSPPRGSYSSSQNVALGCGTDGATIRYTTDGSEPTSSSTVYSGPIVVSSTTTIKAKAFKSGMTDSDTASATYTINIPPKVATPTFSPSGGTYSSSQSVVLSCSTGDATIRYTTDGSEPSSTSTTYSSPIPVNSGTVTVKAKAFKGGMTDSDTASATYTIGTAGFIITPVVLYAIAAAAIGIAAIAAATIVLLKRQKK
jgi:hypothetical protein